MIISHMPGFAQKSMYKLCKLQCVLLPRVETQAIFIHSFKSSPYEEFLKSQISATAVSDHVLKTFPFHCTLYWKLNCWCVMFWSYGPTFPWIQTWAPAFKSICDSHCKIYSWLSSNDWTLFLCVSLFQLLQELQVWILSCFICRSLRTNWPANFILLM